MNPERIILACVFTAFLSASAAAQADGSQPGSSTVRSSEQKHTRVDSSQAMASAGFRTMRVSEVVGMKLYDSKGQVFGDVKQVVMNQKGRDSLIVTPAGSPPNDRVIPLENVVVRAERFFTKALSDDQLRSMPGVSADDLTALGGEQTVEIGTQN